MNKNGRSKLDLLMRSFGAFVLSVLILSASQSLLAHRASADDASSTDQIDVTATTTVDVTTPPVTITASTTVDDSGTGTTTISGSVTVDDTSSSTPTTTPPIIMPPTATSTSSCSLSADDFHNALSNGSITAGPIVISGDGLSASFTLTNNTSCDAPVSLSAYKTFVSLYAQNWLSTQELFDTTALTPVTASSTQTLNVNLPTCNAQIDSWYGLADTSLQDSDTLYTYPNSPFILTYYFGNNALCTSSSGGGGGTGTTTASTTPGDGTASTTTTDTGSSGGGGGANIGIGGGFGVPLFASSFGGGGSSTGSITTPASCTLLNSYLRYGDNNDPTEVVKLQAFLQRYEGYNVPITGTFDQATLAGVDAFQTKYLSDVMGPWDATQSSGYVYITTKKKINEIACDVAFVINPAEQSIINAYKANQAAGLNNPNGTNPNNSTTSPDIGSLTSTSSIAEVPTNGQGNPNVAAVGGTSVGSRIWNFIKGLFGF